MQVARPVKLSHSSVLTTFLFFVAMMGTRPLIALLALELGMSTAEIGVLTALFALLSLFGATSAGAWMDLRGAKFVIRLGVVLTAIGLAIPWLWTTAAGLYLSQLISGSGFTLFTIASQRMASNVGATAEQSQRSINTFSLAVSFGSFAGPTLLGGVAEYVGLKEAMVLMAAPLCLCLILIAREADTPQRMRQIGARNISINPLNSLGFHPYMLRAFMISTFVLLARDSFMAFFPLFAQGHGISTTWIGIIVGVHNLGSLTARGALMPSIRAFGSNWSILGSILLAGLFCIALPFTDNLVWMLIVAFGIGVGLGVGQPLSIAMCSRLAPADRVGEVLGARLTFNRLTQVVAPMGFGFAAASIGLSGVFWLTGLVMIIGLPALHVPDHISRGGEEG